MDLPKGRNGINFVGRLGLSGIGTGKIRWGIEGWRQGIWEEITEVVVHLGDDMETSCS